MKIGVLGLGSIGKRHFDNFKKLGCEVRGHDPGMEGYDRHQVMGWADALVVASPTNHHWRDIEDITNHGKPMLVEKPIVATRAEQVNTLDFYVKMVGYNLRFHSCVIQARKWLGDGLIGKPIWARFTCAQYNDKSVYRRDGVILNWSHEIDLALYLLGKAEVKASVIQDELENMAEITLQHCNTECLTTVHLDYLTTPEQRGFVVVGEEGSIGVDLVQRTALVKPGDYPDIFFQGKDSFDENYVTEAQAFLDRVDGLDNEGCDAKEALEVVDICLTAKEMVK